MSTFRYCAVIKFLTLKGMQTKDIYDPVARMYRETAPSYATVKRWTSEFGRWQQSLKDEHHRDRPVDTVHDKNIKAAEDCVMAGRRVSIHQIALTTGISKTSVKWILHKYLDMIKVCARWVARMLTDEMKQNRRAISADNLRLMENNEEEFYRYTVTGDEARLHQYNPENKWDSMQWNHLGSPTPRKFKVMASPSKIMCTIDADMFC